MSLEDAGGFKAPWALLALVAAALAAAWALGSGFPSGNNLYHLPLVLDYAGSAEGPHDAFHRSLVQFVSLFWSGVRLVATEQNVRMLFLALWVATMVATVLAAYAAVRSAGARREIAVVGLGLICFGFAARGIYEFGGGELLAHSLTHSQVATAIALLAVAFTIRRWWFTASVACGVAADVNLFLGFWSFLAVGAASVILALAERQRVPWRELFKMGIACAATSSPALAWALQSRGSSVGLDFSYADFLNVYHPYHFFVDREPWLFAALLGLLVMLSRVIRETVPDGRMRSMAAIALGAALTLSAGAASGYLSSTPLVLNLHPLRFAAVVYWISVLTVIALWSHLARHQHERAALGAVAVAGFLLPTPAVTVLALVLLADVRRLDRRRVALQYVVLAISLIVPALSAGRFDFPLWIRVGQVPVMVVICGIAVLAIARCECYRRADRVWLLGALGLVMGSRVVDSPLVSSGLAACTLILVANVQGLLAWRRAWSAGVLVLGGVMLLAEGWLFPEVRTRLAVMEGLLLAAILGALLPARALPRELFVMSLCTAVMATAGLLTVPRSGFDFPRWSKDENWFAAQAWARDSTPPGTLFFAPDRYGFAVLSRRPVWWDHSQGAAVMWAPSFHREWDARRRRARTARTLDQQLRLAASERIRYLVLECARFDEAQDVPASIVYRNADYCVAAIEPGPV